MVRGVNGLQAYQRMAGPEPVANPIAARAADASSFTTAMSQAIDAVESQHVRADGAVAQVASGQQVDLHGMMIELEQADIAMRAMISVRDRFISAYEQVMNMSV